MTQRLSSALSDYEARDGSLQAVRVFDSQPASDKVLILLHGVTEPGKYLVPMAEFIANEGLANVVVPDLRGYGDNPARRGDIDYIGQFDDDLEDLVALIRKRRPDAKIIMGGHSLGGGTVLRQAIKPVAKEIYSFLLLSPALNNGSPVFRKGNTNESITNVPRIVLLMLLNSVGIRRWNGAIVYRRMTPKEQLHGTESLNLSFRLMLSRVPGNNIGDYISRLTANSFILVGSEDEVFVPEAYQPIFAKHSKLGIHILQGHNHDQIIQTEQALATIGQWMKEL
ncbi:alpha/beta hydrolase [Paenibacillus andongensis]|uniref:alpha/beta hydrolase n=1 Tax=Paenibacillus andongensis TaxID=2975482 RepID=UPI0021BA6E7A|nr:alpha/beta hydrolase [Paenibacillus andongensis]